MENKNERLLAESLYEFLTVKLKPIESKLDDEGQVELDGIVSRAANRIAQRVMTVVRTGEVPKTGI